MRRRMSSTIALYTALVVVSALWVVPLVWMLSLSFKPTAEVLAEDPTFLPRAPTLEPYRELLFGSKAAAAEAAGQARDPFDYLLYARNTLVSLVLS